MHNRMVGVVVAVLILCGCLALVVRAEDSDQKEDWIEYIEWTCAEKQISPELVEAVIERESGWNPDAQNGECVGLMQVDQVIHWKRAQDMGVCTLMDPYDNIRVGISILEDLLKKYGEPAPALMYYNAGYSEACGITAYNNGIISRYAEEIMERSIELERLHGK